MSDLEKIFTKMFEDAVKIFEGSSRILKDPVGDLEKIFTKIFEDAVKIFDGSLRMFEDLKTLSDIEKAFKDF